MIQGIGGWAARARSRVDPRWGPRLTRIATWVLVVVAAFEVVETTLDLIAWSWAPSIDFMPLRGAATSLLAGHSVYADPRFVYPPSAAPLFLPLTLGSPTTACMWWTLAGGVAIVATGLYAGRQMTRHRLAGGAAVVLVLLIAPFADIALWLGQLTALLVPVAAVVMISFHRGRWTLGCAVLAASLLVKPLLLPLLLVPVLRRQWRALALSLAPTAVAGGVAALSVPGGLDVDRYVGYVLRGTNLHGANAWSNLTLRGWAELHGVPHTIALAASMLVVVVTASTVGTTRRCTNPHRSVQLALLLFVTALLAGSVSEPNYLVVLTAAVCVRVSLDVSARTIVIFAAPLVAVVVQPALLGIGSSTTGTNSWYTIVETLVLVASWTDLLSTARVRAAAVTVDPEAATAMRIEPALATAA